MKKRYYIALIFLLSIFLLTGCNDRSPEIVETTSREIIESVQKIVSAEELKQFPELYPDLKYADLSGSSCYAEIQEYIQQNPQVNVLYSISLGGKVISPDTTELVLNPEDYEFGTMVSALPYLHQLKSVYFEKSTLMPETIDSLRKQFPIIQFDYSILFCDSIYDGKQKVIDLSSADPETVIYNAAQLELLPDLQEIVLTGENDTSTFDLQSAAKLQRLLPDVFLTYSFTLFDQKVSTTTEEVIYANKYIGNKEGNLEILRDSLTVMKHCSRFVLDNCHFDNDDMANLRNEFRGQTKLVWRIFYGEGSILTDRTMIRHVYGLYDSNSVNLKYCEDAEYVDFGHNEFLKNCEFVRGMPHLKAIILSGSMVSDLSPFSSCKELEFLELAYCGYVSDLTPLSECSSLQRLNIAYTKADDLTPLYDLPLQVLVDARSSISKDNAQDFDSSHPMCIVQHTGDAKDDFPYGYPWRYYESGDPNSYYALLQEKFHYPDTHNTIY